ncbi:glycerol-3-phosphate 1-O-acyltransferase PlsY [Vreelandella rituensis]|uniref:Glycerol-3-phosphate acyltransferase n=1 Tax=Vreelandella rituensis TaxID=2282306 RepID=A0A368U8C3_9GAMM|nr:glycerol-3-phosphate 1-O-acyltransferase PlsY [Halomonas rituensis]RCV93215.1 glycerol-3-phosphate 1-O-acyltransferase [Halomonas rituensis]
MIWILVGYLCGSWLAALSVCRWGGVADPRQCGSFNPGASNVLRMHGSRLALMTVILDALKGMPVAGLVKWLGMPIWLQGAVGLAVLLGHSYPLWHGFRGGKAVASALGVLLVLVPEVALLGVLSWALLAWWLKNPGRASIVSALLTPLLSLWLTPEYTGVVAVFSVLVLARHWHNLRRLRRDVAARLKGP